MTTSQPLRFHDSLVPRVPAGTYRITVEQSVNGVVTPTGPARLDRAPHDFVVRAPHFALPADAVHGVYPPSGGRGRYDHLLPHVTLAREQLPWEVALDTDGDLTPPWLAVMVFAAGELPDDPQADGRTEKLRVADLLTRVDREVRPDPARFTDLPDDERAAVCQTVLVPRALFRQLAPTTSDLPYLAHLREGGGGETNDTGPGRPGSYAVVFSARFPDTAVAPNGQTPVPPLRHVAHLVSLEGHERVLDSDPGADVRLVSLWSWVFDNLPDGPKDFAVYARDLAAAGQRPPGNVLAAPAPAQLPDDLAQRLSHGHTPLETHTQGGEHTFAWYRGPLTPVPAAGPADAAAPWEPAAASEALVYGPRTGVFDVGWAAAYTLGHALALADADFAEVHVSRLRGLRRQRDAARPADAGTARVTGRTRATLFALAPESSRSRLTALGTDLPSADSWLDRLRLLENVPFHYLVPDPAMLPPESLRFCYVDPWWLDALEAGAAGLGVGDAADADIAAAVRADRTRSTPAAGMLLRSSLVAGWPTLGVDASDGRGDVNVLRRAALARDVLLILWDRVPERVVLHEPYHSAHLGVRPTGAGEIVLRRVEGAVGEAFGEPLPVAGFLRGGQGERVLEPARLAAALQGRLGLPAPPTPAMVALQLLAATEIQVFGKENP